MNRVPETANTYGVCWYCGNTEGPFEVDHIFPKSLRKDNRRTNLVCACRKCNREKGNKALSFLDLEGEPEWRDHDVVEQIIDTYTCFCKTFEEALPEKYASWINNPFKSSYVKSFMEELSHELPVRHDRY